MHNFYIVYTTSTRRKGKEGAGRRNLMMTNDDE